MTSQSTLDHHHPLLLQAQALYQAGKLAEAEAVYRQLLTSFPDNSPLLMTLGTVLLKTGRFAEAADFFAQAVAIDPAQPQTLLYLGICRMRLQNYPAALSSYDQALALQPDYADAWCNRGNALIKLEQPANALSSFERAIAIKADFVLAHFNRANLLRDLKRPVSALQAYQQTLRLNANFADAWLNQGAVYKELKRPEDALHSYEQALRLKPGDASIFYNRGNALLELKQYQQAVDSYRQAIALNANLAEAYTGVGNALRIQGHFAEALLSYEQAIRLDPNQAEAFCQRGIALNELKRHDEALQSFSQAIALNPGYADAYCNLGICLQNLKRYTQALDNYQQALQLDPKHADAYNNRGNTYKLLNQHAQALADFDQALTINPEFAEAWCNRAIVLNDLKQIDEALLSCEKALALKADFADAYNNRALILEGVHRFQEALRSYEQALAIKPDLDYVAGQCLSSRLMLCQWDKLDERMDEILTSVRNGLKVINPFIALAVSDNPAIQLQAAKIFAADSQPEPVELPALSAYPQHQRIKIAYFSADFCQHPVALLSAKLYELHDRQRFEVFAFSSTLQSDDTTQRLQAAFEHFIDIRQMSDRDALQLVRSLEIDIAIDLGGHTSNSRSALFALRIAPLQLGYLGYSGTLGGDYLDYLLADSTLIPERNQAFYTETIACLPHSYMVNDDSRAISATVFSRQDFDLPETGFVFCCFNNTYKLNPAVFDCWMRILSAVADSVLWLSVENSTAIDNLRREAEQRGVAAERLVFAKRLPSLADHLARLKLADLFLDTLPYNAHTTTSDALWAGLPVLTCAGESFAGRVAASLLTAIDLPELITDTQAAYEALAIALACQPEKLAAIKARLAHNRVSSPLFDTALFTQDIEAVYMRMHDRQLAGLPPEPIYP
jgi:predicted O-linked N-acetylglucosamine transferase (SPINDLY family)